MCMTALTLLQFLPQFLRRLNVTATGVHFANRTRSFAMTARLFSIYLGMYNFLVIIWEGMLNN